MIEIGRGRTAQVFEWGNDKVLKLFNVGWTESHVRLEASNAELASRSGAPAPTVHGVEQVGGRWGIVSDRLEGPVMGDVFFESDEPMSLIVELAELLARVHRGSAPELETITSQWLARTHFPDEPHLEQAASAAADRLPDGDTLLHADFHPFNVMRSVSGEWVVIDWDSAARGHPAADVARSMFLLVEAVPPDGPMDAGLTKLRHEAGEVFLESYRKITPVSDADIAAFRLPMLAARLGEGIEVEYPILMPEIRALAADA